MHVATARWVGDTPIAAGAQTDVAFAIQHATTDKIFARQSLCACAGRHRSRSRSGRRGVWVKLRGVEAAATIQLLEPRPRHRICGHHPKCGVHHRLGATVSVALQQRLNLRERAVRLGIRRAVVAEAVDQELQHGRVTCRVVVRQHTPAVDAPYPPLSAAGAEIVSVLPGVVEIDRRLHHRRVVRGDALEQLRIVQHLRHARHPVDPVRAVLVPEPRRCGAAIAPAVDAVGATERANAAGTTTSVAVEDARRLVGDVGEGGVLR